MSNKKVLSGLTFCISGTLSKGRKEVEAEIKKYGGKTASSVTKSVTHLLTTENEVESETTKVKAAMNSDGRVKLVKEDFIWDSIKLGTLQPEKKYSFDEEEEPEEEDEDDDGQDDTEFQPPVKKRKILQTTDSIVKFTNFSLLMDDLIYSIFKFATFDELLILSRVSHRFNDMITNENNEATVTFLIQAMNIYIKATRKVSEPYQFFSLIHNEQYTDTRHTKLQNTEEEDSEQRVFPININNDRLERLSMTFEKFKEIVKRRNMSVEKALQFNPKAKKEELLGSLSLFEFLKFRFAFDQKMLSPLTCAKISDGEDSLSFDEDTDEKNNGPTFKGGLKKQLRLLQQYIEHFREINLSRYTEDSMDTPPKVYVDWIENNKGILKNIKSLYFLDIEQSDAEVSWIYAGNISPIWNAMPNLTFWTSKGSIELALSANISHHNLRSITFISAGLNKEFLSNLFTAYLPKLAHLELFLGTDNQGADFEPSFLKEKLLTQDEIGLFPALEYLGLRNYEKIDKITKDIFDSAIAKRVKVIDISLGNISDRGVLGFIDKLEKNLTTDFIGLEVLDLNRCYISKNIRERLLALPIIVDTEPAEEDDFAIDINEDDDDDMGERYIAISE